MRYFSSIKERIEATEAWIVEMNTDFGKDDLEYSKNKAETDLEQLEASWNILNDMEKNGEDETIRSSASDCKLKLDEAIQKLRDFIRELSIAIEYEEKQGFLVHVSFSALTGFQIETQRSPSYWSTKSDLIGLVRHHISTNLKLLHFFSFENIHIPKVIRIFYIHFLHILQDSK